MLKKMISLSVVVMTLAATSMVSAAPTVSGITLGQYAAGPTLTKEELKGRVVLVEYWGVRCGPCIGSIPHITELQKKYGRDRFVVVANHVQSATPSQAGSVWNRFAKTNIVSVMHMGRVAEVNVNGIPHCVLFDHEGKMVYNGHPSQVDKPLLDAIRKAPPFLIADREYNTLKREALSIGKLGSSFPATLAKLRTIAADSNTEPEKLEEAKRLIASVTQWATQRLKVIKTDLKVNPLFAKEELNRMTRLFRKDKELGEPFLALDKETKTDKSFIEEIKAAKALNILKAKAEKMGIGTIQSGAGIEQKKAAYKKALEQFSEKYDGTVAAKKASQLIIDMQL